MPPWVVLNRANWSNRHASKEHVICCFGLAEVLV
jgi:hypothetical protein